MYKRFLIILFAMFTVSVYADSYLFRTTEFAYKTYGSWSDWESSDLYILIDFDNDVIQINSPKPQTYRVLYYNGKPYDSSGEQVSFRVIDQDGDYGNIRLRVQNNGTSQLYVDFNNISWVYNIYRVR